MHRISAGMILTALAAKNHKAVDKRIKPFIKRRNFTKEGAGASEQRQALVRSE